MSTANLASLWILGKLENKDGSRGFLSAEAFFFYFFLWNSWKELGKIWNEVRTQHLQPKLFLVNRKSVLASYWRRPFCASASEYCVQLWTGPVLFSPCRYLSLICPVSVLIAPTLQFCNIILNVLFNDPFLAHRSRRLEWAIVIARRPSVRPSSSSSVNFSHFRLLLQNR